MAENPARPVLDWSGKAPFPFTRESSIRLDSEGRFFHDGALVEHPGLAQAMGSWISKHPNDGRWVLENGYDWCYLTVDDTPYVAKSASIDGDRVALVLNDGSVEKVAPETLCVDASGTIRSQVHAEKKYGPYPVRLARHAQLALGEHLKENDGGYVLAIGDREVTLQRA